MDTRPQGLRTETAENAAATPEPRHGAAAADHLGAPNGVRAKDGVGHPASEAACLRADHERLEELAESIIRTIVEGDREDVSSAVSALQASVGAHLDGEERELIPRYAEHDAAGAALLSKDHAAIRNALAELDVATDLHLVRADSMRAFLASLRAHAARENLGLYRWLASTLEPTPKG